MKEHASPSKKMKRRLLLSLLAFSVPFVVGVTLMFWSNQTIQVQTHANLSETRPTSHPWAPPQGDEEKTPNTMRELLL